MRMVLTLHIEQLQTYPSIATRVIFYFFWEGTALARILGWGAMLMQHSASSHSLTVLLLHSDCLQLNHVTILSLKRFKYVLAGSHRFNSTICCTAAWRDSLSYSHFSLTCLPNILLLFRICICAFRQARIGIEKWIILYNDVLNGTIYIFLFLVSFISYNIHIHLDRTIFPFL